MTKETMALIELIEKGADSDLVREMLAFRRTDDGGGGGDADWRGARGA